MKFNKLTFLVIILLPFISFSGTYTGIALDTFGRSISSSSITSDNFDTLVNQMTENLVFFIEDLSFNPNKSYTKQEILSILHNPTNQYYMSYNIYGMFNYLGIASTDSPVVFSNGVARSSFMEIYSGQNYKISFLQGLFSYYNFNFYNTKSLRSILLNDNNIYNYEIASENEFYMVLNYSQTIANLKNSGLLQNTEFIKNNAALIAQLLSDNLPSITQNIKVTTEGVSTITNQVNEALSHLDSISAATSDTYSVGNDILLHFKQKDGLNNQYNGTDIVPYADNPTIFSDDALFVLYRDYLIRNNRYNGEEYFDTSDAWRDLGLDKSIGIRSVVGNSFEANQQISLLAKAFQDAQKQNATDLAKTANAMGQVVDPLTGALTDLSTALKDWSSDKINGAIASYQYNNPAATNGFFGELKRHLTEEADWRLLDKGVKKDLQGFMDNVQNKGVKIDDTKPLVVSISNKEGSPVSVTIPDEFLTTHTFRTTNESLDKFVQMFESWNASWLTFTGLDEGIARNKGWLQLQYWQDSDYYNFMTNNLAYSLSNQLDRIIANTSLTNTGQIVTVDAVRGFYPYDINFVSTLQDPDDMGFWIREEPYEPFSGVTNYNQAVVNLLLDNFAAAANNVKANQMSFEWIRAIYYAMHTNSNMLDQVAYITNQVFSAAGLSTNTGHDYEQEYQSFKDTLDTEFDSLNTTITEWRDQSKQKLDSITTVLFGSHLMPSRVVVFEFHGQKFTADLKKMETPIKLMHYGSMICWLAVGLLMLPRVVYMLLCFTLRMMSKFYRIMKADD